MTTDTPIQIKIKTEMDVALAVLQASKVSEELGFDASRRNMIATAVSELARNIIKYAGNGEIIFVAHRQGRRQGIQVTAADRGPGIADVDQALKDHYSSSGTLGLGLPGVRRLMDEFELDSGPERGTRVQVRKWL